MATGAAADGAKAKTTTLSVPHSFVLGGVQEELPCDDGMMFPGTGVKNLFRSGKKVDGGSIQVAIQMAAPSAGLYFGSNDNETPPTGTTGVGRSDTLGPSTATDQRTVLPEPAADADAYDRKEYIKYQLDTLQGQEVLGGLVFQQGLDSRATGGTTPLLTHNFFALFCCSVLLMLYRTSFPDGGERCLLRFVQSLSSIDQAECGCCAALCKRRINRGRCGCRASGGAVRHQYKVQTGGRHQAIPLQERVQ